MQIMETYTQERFAALTLKKQLTMLFELGKSCEEGSAPLKAFREMASFLQLPEGHPLIPAFDKLKHYPAFSALSDLLIFLVPLERHLGRAVRDDDFLVFDTDRPRTRREHPIYLILENIRSAFNVGNMLRIADCLGAAHVYLAGYTATPENEKVRRSDLGSSEALDWSSCSGAEEAIQALQAKHIPVYALETTSDAASLYETDLPSPLGLVVGNEVHGVNRQTLDLCDRVLTIPTWGIKNSLNVANCLAVAGFEVLRRWEGAKTP